MENGARPAAGANWLAAAPPDFRARVVQKILKNLSQVPQGQQVDELRLHECASGYEAKVFNQSDNAEDYLRSISHKMMCLQHRWQPVASQLQQQAQMGRHQMRPVDAVLANSSRATMPQTAPGVPLPLRPPQLHNMHIRANQAQPATLPPVAPVVQLHPCHQTVATQIQAPCPASHNPAQQPQPRMNRQDSRVDQRQSYQTHNGQHANVATMQTRQQCGGQNNQQFENPHPAGEVDWREDMFHKITSLKDAHLSELLEFARLLGRLLPIKENVQLESLPKEQAAQCRLAQHTMGMLKNVLRFLQVQKTDIPEVAKDQLDEWQTAIHKLLRNYRSIKARSAAKSVGRQSQNCREPPRVVNMISGAADNSQQNHHEQHAAEALSHSSENTPSETPFTPQQNHSDHLAGEAEDNSVRGEAESPVAANLPSDTAPFTGTTCSQEIQQRRPADEVIPQLTQTVEHAGTSPAQQQTHSAHSVRAEAEDGSVRAEAERPVGMEALIEHRVDTTRSSSPAALRSLASDMGVNLKRAFHHTTSDTMDGRSCHKRRKTYDSALDEIRATCNMLVETEIRISEDDTGGAGGTAIELCYNSVSLTARLREAICTSAISTKLLVPADYPLSSPVILGSDGEGRNGVAGVVNMAFRRAIVLLPEPRSIEGMANAWDSVVRRAVVQFAHRLGGGTFSSRYGQWESCIPV